jgi:hypothetical protein
VFLGTALALKRCLRVEWGGVGDRSHLASASDAAPLPDAVPCAEEIWLHVEPVAAVHVPRGVAAMQGDAGQARSLDMVASLTL